MTRSNFLASAR